MQQKINNGDSGTAAAQQWVAVVQTTRNERQDKVLLAGIHGQWADYWSELVKLVVIGVTDGRDLGR